MGDQQPEQLLTPVRQIRGSTVTVSRENDAQNKTTKENDDGSSVDSGTQPNAADVDTSGAPATTSVEAELRAQLHAMQSQLQ